MSPQVRAALWGDFVELERRLRYYSAISSKYSRWNSWVQLAFAIATLIGFASFQVPTLAPVAPFLFLTAIFLERHHQIRERMLIAELLTLHFRKAQTEWSSLWNAAEAHLLSDEEALSRQAELTAAINDPIRGLDLRLGFGADGDKQLCESTAKEADEVMTQSYAAA